MSENGGEQPAAGDAAMDSQGQKPEGVDFSGKSLRGADFSGSDLRGADFTGADLRDASFREVKFGLRPRVGVMILGVGILIAIAAGVVIGLVVVEIRNDATADEWDRVAAGGSLGFLILLFLGLVFWKGFDVAIRVVVVAYVLVAAVNVVANLIWEDFEWFALARGTALVVVVVLAVTAGLLGRVIGGVFGAWSVAIVAILGGLATGQFHGGVAGVVVAVSMAVLSKRAVRGDPRDHTLLRAAHWLVRRWGTQFVDADLTGADFTGTNAMRCDTRGATVTDVTWDPTYPLPVDLLVPATEPET